MKFIKEENWKVENNSITVEDIITNHKNFKYFAGDMRKLLQLAKENYSIRTMKETISLDTSNNKILSRDDFMKSIEQFKIVDEVDRYYNASMYC